MNSNEMLQSTATTAITVAQLLENSQLQVLTHEYLYTSVIMEAEYNLDLILLPIQWIKSTWYKTWSFKRHLGKKNEINSSPSACVSIQKKWDGGEGSQQQQKKKTWHSISWIIDRIHVFSKFGIFSYLKRHVNKPFFTCKHFFNCVMMIELRMQKIFGC